MLRAIVLVISVLAMAVPAEAGAPSQAANEKVIRHVFGPAHDDEAVAVARCESGLSIWARSPGGTYLGLFQFGPYARARYGFAWNAWAQARAARRYFQDAGWAPWSCAP